MSLYEAIISIYPDAVLDVSNGNIVIKNDSDGTADYIKEWNVDYPLPADMKVGKEEK